MQILCLWVFDKDKVVFVCDNFTPNKDIASAEQIHVTHQSAKKAGLTHYYGGGTCSIEHVFLPVKGLVGPWDLVIDADSHICIYGGIGAFSIGMDPTDIAVGMVPGETWLRVPLPCNPLSEVCSSRMEEPPLHLVTGW
ncbi:MAG: hypothetical protein LBU24_05900 [Methanocalculaceae archaeon]|nr:hypothetical protein [Methanocalculaceae archaeon]